MKRLFHALAASTALASAALAQTEAPAQQATTQADKADMPAAGQQLTVSDFRKQMIYTGAGAPAGRIVDVFTGQDGQTYAVVALGQGSKARQTMVPTNAIGYENNRFVIGMNDEQLQSLPAYRKDQAGLTQLEPTTALAIRGYGAGLAQAGDQPAQQGAGGNITVQQPAATIQVEQATPQVTVQQATPQVTVNQPQPEIIVRQAPPTITVDQPQPEIIVRMPEPNVNVSMAQPQVQVQMAKPQVQVVQPKQPEVNVVQSGQAKVAVTQPQEQAQVSVERAQPKVTYERTGQPRVVYNEAQGQPKITFERMAQGQTDAGQAPAQGSQTSQETATQLGEQPAEQPAQQAAGDAQQPAVGTAPATGAQERQAVAASELKGRNVYNLAGQDLGEIRDILIGPDKQVSLVVEYGGFLGIGERTVIMPMNRFALQGDRLLIPGMTEDELKAQPAWDRKMDGYQAVDAGQRIDLGVAQ